MDRITLENLKNGLDGPGTGTPTSESLEVEAARARLTLAVEALANLSPDASQSEIALRQGDVSVALAVLATEEQSLAAIQAGVYPYEVELQVAGLFLARADLEDAV